MSATPTAVTRPAPTGVGSFSSPPDRRHLLGLEGMARAELLGLLDDADAARAAMDRRDPHSDELRDVTVCNAFFENSTRTRVSFELAEQRVGASRVSFTATDSSTVKGETLLDTLRVIQSMRVDLLVVRHAASGSAAYLARELDAGVINAGDGAHEHPTQGLLDLLTLRRSWGGRFEGRRIVITGDVAHSRVARSAIHGLNALGAQVVLAGPATLMPAGVETLGVTVAPSLDEAMAGADAVMALRLQHERMEQGLLASLGEYARAWGVSEARVERMKPEAIVMHPGPMNRGVEIAPEVADGPRSRIFEQVTNGVAVRMAVLRRCARALAEAR